MKTSDTTTTTTKKSLTDETTWKLRFVLTNVPTRRGQTLEELLLTMDVQFTEDVGYEPPQGTLQQVVDTSNNNNNSTAVVLTKSRWTLSEDPNERKDSLWIWGLFEEPLYPFLLLQLETSEFPIASSNNNNNDDDDDDDDSNKDDDDNNNDVVLPLKLYAQFQHRRDAQEGVVLSSNTAVTVRTVETVSADPFGAAKVDLYEDVPIGRVGIAP
eukprot:CAMPEP_0116560040 /NCGR_PEP_ID=MMETSP0397-20121206/10748_1 /TAXON_ID=216820 /ORGANISM="Cyclophora tenuis, Strain ECT3854" /LENGTH=212 /DNA_ID=CAMNT_0004085911 /DNA_START=174 /DNA_END=808 /DNA_ORIENTATION=+